MIDLSFGNINTKSLNEIWHSKDRNDFLVNKKQLEAVCQKCNKADSCVNWCLGDHFNNKHSFIINDKICNIADLFNKNRRF